MNETVSTELQQRILGYLDAIESTAQNAGDFVVEQTPLVAQEYLAWEFWGNVMIAVVCSSIFIAYLATIRRLYRKIASRDAVCADLDANLAVALVSIFVACPSIIGALVSVFYAVKVCVAPRLVLLEKVSDLMQ